MTLEHIWPQALGGDCSPPLFQTKQVCRTCNNRAGLFVDGAFCKSWFVKFEVLNSGYEFLDPIKPGIVPLAYMGFDKDYTGRGQTICERWAGPAGAHVYHFHEADEERWMTFAGGDPIRRKKRDGGRAYLLLTSNSQYWAVSQILSFLAHFPVAKKRSLTQIEGASFKDLLKPEDGPLTATEGEEIEYIRSRSQTGHMSVPMAIDFADRFLAKLALGLAHNLLAGQGTNTPYADELRKFLWSRSIEERESLRVRGTNYLQGAAFEQLSSVISLRGAWVLMLIASPIGLALMIFTPAGRMMSIALTDSSSTIPADVGRYYKEGILYVFVPGRRQSIGPMPLANFLEQRAGLQSGEVSDLLRSRTDRSNWPPF